MEKTNLEMIRGDTLSFAFEVDFDEAPQKLEKADFSCKVNLDDDEALFHKELGDGIDFLKQDGTKMYYIVRIAPEDTENLEAGLYYYDLQIEMNGDVFTILNGTLKIESDVTTVKTFMTKYKGIKEIKKTGTDGLVDTYTITLTDGTASTFTVTNGKGISNIRKTGTDGLVDTYTITLTDGTASTFTVTNGDIGYPTDEQVQNSVDKWLMEHPEATTTVEDGSITEEKFSSDTKLWNTQGLSIISNEYKNSGYSGELFNQFGANINVFADYIDTGSNKELYYRVYRNNVVGDGKVGIKLACYDEGKNYLYTMSDLSGDYTSKFTILRYIVVNETLNEANVRVKAICRADIPDEVKFVRFAIQGNSDFVKAFYEKLVISYEDFTDYDAVEKTVYNTKLITAVESITSSSGKPEPKSKTLVMIGDSLTNWGGGNDTGEGFLKIVHDSTGVVTANEGLAGAWWQTGDGQTQCGVKRVDKIIADKRKYDMYCFMLGTNAGSITDTGETSADTSTMCGAIRYCMEKLKAYDPTSTILVLLPPQRAEGNDSQEKVNAVIKSIVNSYSVKTLDIYHESGIVPNTKIANVNYLSDGLHLNKNGYTALGKILSSEVKYLLCI